MERKDKTGEECHDKCCVRWPGHREEI
jgi:hypothetical protein